MLGGEEIRICKYWGGLRKVEHIKATVERGRLYEL